MKATVDENLCIGCGLCEDTCPDGFRIMDDGYSHVICEKIGEDSYDCVRESEEICPVDAISFSEGD